jgi:hypothetical protein
MGMALWVPFSWVPNLVDGFARHKAVKPQGNFMLRDGPDTSLKSRGKAKG